MIKIISSNKWNVQNTPLFLKILLNSIFEQFLFSILVTTYAILPPSGICGNVLTEYIQSTLKINGFLQLNSLKNYPACFKCMKPIST